MKDDAYNTKFLLEMPEGYDNIEGEGFDSPVHGPFDLRLIDISMYAQIDLDQSVSHMLYLAAPAQYDGQYPFEAIGFSKNPHYDYASRIIKELFYDLNGKIYEIFHLKLDVWDRLYRHVLAVHDEFAEFIVIDRSSGVLHILVVSSA